MNPLFEHQLHQTRRQFLQTGKLSLGAVALAAMNGGPQLAAAELDGRNPLAPRRPPLPARAKNVIYLHMSGGPPQ